MALAEPSLPMASMADFGGRLDQWQGGVEREVVT
jgi:hypothetical protein